jgi:hypothetical protein
VRKPESEQHVLAEKILVRDELTFAIDELEINDDSVAIECSGTGHVHRVSSMVAARRLRLQDRSHREYTDDDRADDSYAPGVSQCRAVVCHVVPCPVSGQS